MAKRFKNNSLKILQVGFRIHIMSRHTLDNLKVIKFKVKYLFPFNSNFQMELHYLFILFSIVKIHKLILNEC